MGFVMYRITTRHLLRVGQACATLFAIQLVVLGLHLPLVWLVAAAFIGGLGSVVVAIGWDTSLQEYVRPDVLSRVSSYDSLGSHIGVAVIGGIIYAVVALLPLAWPSVRNLQHAT
jgi:hypothetical protein